LGLRPADVLKTGMPSRPAAVPDLPDLPEEEEPHG